MGRGASGDRGQNRRIPGEPAGGAGTESRAPEEPGERERETETDGERQQLSLHQHRHEQEEVMSETGGTNECRLSSSLFSFCIQEVPLVPLCPAASCALP